MASRPLITSPDGFTSSASGQLVLAVGGTVVAVPRINESPHRLVRSGTSFPIGQAGLCGGDANNGERGGKNEKFHGRHYRGVAGEARRACARAFGRVEGV